MSFPPLAIPPPPPNQQSIAVSPRSASRLTSRTPSRATSPTRVGAASRRSAGRLLLSPTKSSKSSKESSRDPLKILPSEISQKIFGLLTIHQLARCARVCRKWSKSQTLNYGAFPREFYPCPSSLSLFLPFPPFRLLTIPFIAFLFSQSGSNITGKRTSTTSRFRPENGHVESRSRTGVSPTSNFGRKTPKKVETFSREPVSALPDTVAVGAAEGVEVAGRLGTRHQEKSGKRNGNRKLKRQDRASWR